MSSLPTHPSQPITISFDEHSAVAQVRLSQIGWRSYALVITAGMLLLMAVLFPIWAWSHLKIEFPPIIGDDVATTIRNQPVDIVVLMNDADPVGIIDLKSVKIEKEPQHGRVTAISETGVVTYVPSPDFEGRDILMYSIGNKEGSRSGLGAVKITVKPMPTN